MFGKTTMYCTVHIRLTDMKEERNRLTKVAFPRLRQHCKDLGLEFQVVDMRWGVTDDMTNEHLVNLLCLEQIEACQRISMGPNFVVCKFISSVM